MADLRKQLTQYEDKQKEQTESMQLLQTTNSKLTSRLESLEETLKAVRDARGTEKRYVCVYLHMFLFCGGFTQRRT